MEEKESQARRFVTRYMWWSMGAGLIPLPVWDLAVITGVQLRMLSVLSKHYEVPFSQNRVKSIVSSLLGSLVPASLTGTVSSASKIIPIIGPIAGGIAMPIFAGASTYAIGKVFIQHFESGGTFLDFEPAKVREYFRQEFEKGQDLASQMRGGKRKETSEQTGTAEA